jgi:hypothetical protein
MSDNAWSYTHNRSLRELVTARQVKHLRTQAYRPQTNGNRPPQRQSGVARYTLQSKVALAGLRFRSGELTAHTGRRPPGLAAQSNARIGDDVRMQTVCPGTREV